MVEGHSVHRVAANHRSKLVGKKFTCTSPNGRFTEGAAAITGKPFRAIEAVGKNLFAWFGIGDDRDVCVHVHFGMAGNWAVFKKDEPDTTPTTRLRMEGGGLVSHLSAMTVQHGTRASLYEPKRSKLGEDPLRGDADVERLWKKVSKSKKSIGALIMDQSCFCGPGNIYRAEILFKARIHPDQIGKDLSRAEFDEVWRHSVELLRRGFEEGSILTVDAADDALYGPDLHRYVYNKSRCPKCSGQIMSWDINSRTAYACLTCQPPPEVKTAAPSPKKRAASSTTPTKRKKATATPTPVKRFRSHCVKDAAEDMSPGMLTVAELKAALTARGAPTGGLKAALVARLTALPPPMRSAEAAAADRARAGESRAVEHVADLHPTQAARAARRATAARK